LSVAIFAVDSLRQLAMKFLERDELANYTFQNEFLRPFVVVMRQSHSVEIRELIIRCVSQVIAGGPAFATASLTDANGSQSYGPPSRCYRSFVAPLRKPFFCLVINGLAVCCKVS
jgi:hypothetical protein